ncbi:hypothetical protein AB4Z22_34195, partial [Paenibacillus sp. TAF58]
PKCPEIVAIRVTLSNDALTVKDEAIASGAIIPKHNRSDNMIIEHLFNRIPPNIGIFEYSSKSHLLKD